MSSNNKKPRRNSNVYDSEPPKMTTSNKENSPEAIAFKTPKKQGSNTVRYENDSFGQNPSFKTDGNRTMINPTLPKGSQTHQGKKRYKKVKNSSPNKNRRFKLNGETPSPRASIYIIDGFGGLSSVSRAGFRPNLSNGNRHRQKEVIDEEVEHEIHQDDHFEHVVRRQALRRAPVEVGNPGYYNSDYYGDSYDSSYGGGYGGGYGPGPYGPGYGGGYGPGYGGGGGYYGGGGYGGGRRRNQKAYNRGMRDGCLVQCLSCLAICCICNLLD